MQAGATYRDRKAEYKLRRAQRHVYTVADAITSAIISDAITSAIIDAIYCRASAHPDR